MCSQGFVREAIGFGVIVGQSLRGGVAVTTLEDTVGNDTLSNNVTGETVNLANARGVYLQTFNFTRVNVLASNGGAVDRAFLSDTTGDDYFLGDGPDGTLFSPTTILMVSLFDSVGIAATTGMDTFHNSNLAYSFAKSGPWVAV